ncbi:MAG: glycosyltransferase family 4 protein [Anditalea sp.]
MSIKTIFQRKSENLKALLRYSTINKELKGNYDLFFFFPFWQIGGGERVHADILKVFKKENTLCFLTDQSINNGFKEEFQNYSTTVVLGRWTEKRSFRLFMLKKIAFTINNRKAPVIFGCHSPFFYSLIPYLKAHVKVVDLIHAFTFDPNGPEIYSLPYVQRLDHRVILGENTKKDFRDLYLEKGIDLKYLERLTIITNKTPIPTNRPSKDYSGNLKVLFVARNAPEKRPEIFVEVTKRCFEKQIPADCIMVGGFSGLVGQVWSNTTLIGELFDKEKLNEIYRQAHLILVTSWREGFPLVIMEGMGHGVVPISTNVGEIPTYISSNSYKNGFLVEDKKNPGEIVDEFVYRISHLCRNKDLLEEFSNNAFEFAQKNFGEEKFEQSYRKLLLETPKEA